MRISGIISNYAPKYSFGADLHIRGKRANSDDLKKLLGYNTGDSFINSSNTEGKQVTHNSSSKKYKSVAYKTEYNKDGEWCKQTWYDSSNGKLQWVRYADGSFNLSRNTGSDWKKTPKIDFSRKVGDKTLMLHAASPAATKKGDYSSVGGFHLVIFNGDKPEAGGEIFMLSDGTFKMYVDYGLAELKEELENLKTVILSDEYSDSFGASPLFNKNLNSAIKYLSEYLKKA